MVMVSQILNRDLSLVVEDLRVLRLRRGEGGIVILKDFKLHVRTPSTASNDFSPRRSGAPACDEGQGKNTAYYIAM